MYAHTIQTENAQVDRSGGQPFTGGVQKGGARKEQPAVSGGSTGGRQFFVGGNFKMYVPRTALSTKKY